MAKSFNIIEAEPVSGKDIFDFINWFCRSFGVITNRDKNDTAGKIFLAILNSVSSKKGVRSQEVADTCGITRGDAIHHLNRLMGIGLVKKEGRRYLLSKTSLSLTVLAVWEDLERVFSKIRKIANEIDSGMGLG